MIWFSILWLICGAVSYQLFKLGVKLENNGTWTIANRVVVLIFSIFGILSLVVSVLYLLIMAAIKWSESPHGKQSAKW
jgi:hypothetical protein